MEVDATSAGAREEKEPEDEDRWGEVMTTKNAAAEAVAATDQEIALKACPFCGAQPRTHHYAGEYGFFAIECPNCNGASEDGTDRFVGVHGDEAEAVAAWNTRSDASTIATLRKALPAWIPVEERLPEAGTPFLARCEAISRGVRSVGIAALVAEEDGTLVYADYENYTEFGWNLSDGAVTHWMPLPDPPAALDEKEGSVDPKGTRN